MLKKLSLTLLLSLLTICLLKSCLPTQEQYLRSKVVKLTGNNHSCSGTQIHLNSGKDYILTAAHCEVLAKDGVIYAQVDGKRPIPRSVVEVSDNTDLMLLEGIPGLKGVSLASVDYIGQHLTALTHGEGFDTYKSEGELIQKAVVNVIIKVLENPGDKTECELHPKYKAIEMETPFGSIPFCALHINSDVSNMDISPGSSGGGVFNTAGKLTAVVYAGNDKFAMLVTLADILDFTNPY